MIRLLEYVYEHTRPSESDADAMDELRKIVIRHIVEHLSEMSGSNDLSNLVAGGGDLAGDLFQATVEAVGTLSKI